MLEIIVRGLAPYVGGNMARAAVEGHAHKLGLRGSELDPSGVDALLDTLSPGLHVFIGREKTVQIVAEIRATIAAARGRR